VSYSPTTWVDGTTKLSAANLNNIETGIQEAIPKAISGFATDKVPVYDGANWVAQKIVDAQISSSAAIAQSKLAFNAWSNYVPVLSSTGTQPVLGSGSSATGRYVQIGKMVFFYVIILFGTSGVSAGTGFYSVSLPVSAATALQQLAGGGWLFDSSAGLIRLHVIEINAAATCYMRFDNSGSGDVSATAPWTWAASDQIRVQGTYEAA
jgi:hypothetical protein